MQNNMTQVQKPKPNSVSIRYLDSLKGKKDPTKTYRAMAIECIYNQELFSGLIFPKSKGTNVDYSTFEFDA